MDPAAVPVPATDDRVQVFIDRWSRSAASERANYAGFTYELCDLLGVPRPDPAGQVAADDAYVLEKAVKIPVADGSATDGRIDVYRRGCFVLEAKQGGEAVDASAAVALADATRQKLKGRRKGTATRGTSAWDQAMIKARHQAEQYARALPAGEPRPPFLLVVDVGYSIELYAEFTQTGGLYVAYPDARSNRIMMPDLLRPDTRDLLRQVWTTPLALDPSRRSARATTELAARLAELARSFEREKHSPEDVGLFLMRCLFTFFAEDAGLLPADGAQGILQRLTDPAHFVHNMTDLWRAMKSGGYSLALGADLKHFNGHLFEDAEALPVNADQLALLAEASRADWQHVEPAIFGTLLERALDPVERHKLGAHYTPRAYVERLVQPTIIEPLTERWKATQAAAIQLHDGGQDDEARSALVAYHRELCGLRVLDPACGSGNFLYVTLEHLKRLEGEVLQSLAQLGAGAHQSGFLGQGGEVERLEVRPEQMLGLEVNPRAAAIAELVLWIGYLQWHRRTTGTADIQEPILGRSRSIHHQDAVLLADGSEPLLDDAGRPRSRWDGRTMKPHPATGEWVPDEAAQVPIVRYLNPRPTAWPESDYIVGNPPFIGASRMRDALGDGYAEALRTIYPDVPDSADYVTYWWHKAAELARSGAIRRFGFITTNSLRQTFNRRVIQQQLDADPPLSIRFAIPDHPWVDSADGAAVRIAMTVAERGTGAGLLREVTSEIPGEHGEVAVRLSSMRGRIHADLTVGAAVTAAVGLRANENLANRGVSLFGSGFIVQPGEAASLGLGRIGGLEQHIRPYLNGRDLNARSRGAMVIDLFGLSAEDARERFPEVYQWVFERVKPERDNNNREGRRRNWWLFGETNPKLRDMLAGLPRYIATVETSKHRFFVFLDASILPDNKLVNIALDDACFLGILSSRHHVAWALTAGGRLGFGNDPVYVKTTCFERFPFPTPSPDQSAHIRALGEQLDAHRKRQQAQHPDLTLTDLYNVLEKLRAGDMLTPKDRATNEKGLVAVLRQIHDELDAAVADAYGLPADLPEPEILERLVALNAERAAEEARGIVRWLRPEYQTRGMQESQAGLAGVELVTEAAAAPAAKAKLPWPKALPERVQAVLAAMGSAGRPATAGEVAGAFAGGAGLHGMEVAEVLSTLTALGLVRDAGDGRLIRG